MTRKEAIKTMAAGTALISTAGIASCAAAGEKENPKEMAATDEKKALKGNINHSVCRWCYNGIPLDELAQKVKDMGLKSVELLNPDEWEVPLKIGLDCAVSFGSPLGIPEGFNDPANHEQLLKDYTDLLPKAADMGLKQMICFSGNRNGLDDETGLENCAVGLEPVVKIAQENGITLIMELLNSKVNHPDYQCDKTPWGAKLCEKVGSDNFKLLYDIYHMQIMEGDVIATIREYAPYIAHYHTGGVPGRNEINETQELYYPAIMRAILETGFTGYVAQEFIPKGEQPLVSLEEGVKICDV